MRPDAWATYAYEVYKDADHESFGWRARKQDAEDRQAPESSVHQCKYDTLFSPGKEYQDIAEKLRLDLMGKNPPQRNMKVLPDETCLEVLVQQDKASLAFPLGIPHS